MHLSSSIFNCILAPVLGEVDVVNEKLSTIALYCHSQGSLAELSTFTLTLAKLPYVGKAPLNALLETSMV